MLQRLPCLPLADAVVTENGGRIFVHDPFLPTAAKFVEDTDWCDSQPSSRHISVVHVCVAAFRKHTCQRIALDSCHVRNAFSAADIDSSFWTVHSVMAAGLLSSWA